jgi:hypothetical protein
MCIHQQFQLAGRQIPSTLTLKGDAIDRYFRLSKESDLIVVWEFTSVYAEMLHAQWGAISRQSRGNGH